MDSCVPLCLKAFEVKGGCYLWQRVCALIEDLVHELVVVFREVHCVESDCFDASETVLPAGGVCDRAVGSWDDVARMMSCGDIN